MIAVETGYFPLHLTLCGMWKVRVCLRGRRHRNSVGNVGNRGGGHSSKRVQYGVNSKDQPGKVVGLQHDSWYMIADSVT